MHSLLWTPGQEIDVIHSSGEHADDSPYMEQPFSELNSGFIHSMNQSKKQSKEAIGLEEPSAKRITLPRYSPTANEYDEQTLRTRQSVRANSYTEEKSMREETLEIRKPKIKVNPNFILSQKGQFIDYLGKTHSVKNAN